MCHTFRLENNKNFIYWKVLGIKYFFGKKKSSLCFNYFEWRIKFKYGSSKKNHHLIRFMGFECEMTDISFFEKVRESNSPLMSYYMCQRLWSKNYKSFKIWKVSSFKSSPKQNAFYMSVEKSIQGFTACDYVPDGNSSTSTFAFILYSFLILLRK